MPKIKILIADGRVIFQTGLASILTKAVNIKISAMCSSGKEAVAKSVKIKPDVVILDANLTECDCSEAITEIRSYIPGVRVIVMTREKIEYENPLPLIDLDPDGYISEDIGVLQLINTIHSVTSGQRAISPIVGVSLLNAYNALRKQKAAVSQLKLTPREVELLSLVAKGLTNKDISQRMFISTNTVKVHLSTIMKKLNATNRQRAVLIAEEKGILIKPEMESP